MRRRPDLKVLPWLTALALLAGVALLTPLAYAVPPDPVWVSGFFDDDDNDNAVFLVTSSTATLDSFPLYAWVPFPVHWSGFVVEAARPGSPPYIWVGDARASPLA